MRRSLATASIILIAATFALSAATAEEAVLHVRGDVTKPARLSGDAPRYSEIAKEARIQGTVMLEAIIDKSGDIRRVRTIKGLPMELTDNAIAAVKTWKYEPATLDGEPVSVYYQVTINFRLDKDKKDEPGR